VAIKTPQYRGQIKRRVRRIEEFAMNEYGLDYKYFQRKCSILARDARDYKPDEMARALLRLASVADKAVLNETEFTEK
jgi:hypothetical protein